jgi:NAD(P)-dependent dehydrogenase (short-subunit alcohol dehydrogenase family)
VKHATIDLAGAVALVTGGGRGIGRATAAALARAGARVVVGDVDLAAAEDAARAIRGALGLALDVTDRASFAAFVDAATDRHGRADVLVNNAGVMPLGAFLDEPDRQSRWTMDVNLWGLVHGMRLVLPGMIARGRGHVVNVASMAGKIPVPGMAMYNASKFAAVGLSAAVRRELEGTGVTVSTVLPSAVRTGLVAGVPLGGGMPTVEPEDVAAAIVRSVRTRRAEIPVPGYLAGWGVLDAIVPERAMAFARALLRDRRALTSVDAEGRREYTERVARQQRDAGRRAWVGDA